MRSGHALLAALASVLLLGAAPAPGGELHGVAVVIGESDYVEAKSLCEAAIAGKVVIGVDAGDTPGNLAAIDVALAKLN